MLETLLQRSTHTTRRLEKKTKGEILDLTGTLKNGTVEPVAEKLMRMTAMDAVTAAEVVAKNTMIGLSTLTKNMQKPHLPMKNSSCAFGGEKGTGAAVKPPA